MSLEGFQLIHNEAIDDSTIERKSLKNHHHQAAKINDSYQYTEFIFGENNIHHEIGNDYFEYELKTEEDVAVAANRAPAVVDSIRLINNAFVYCFKDARLSITRGSDVEHDQCRGQVSAIMRALTKKDGHFLFRFDKIDESEAEIENTSLHHHLINNHYLAANKGKTKGQLPLEHSLDFARHLKKLLNN